MAGNADQDGPHCRACVRGDPNLRRISIARNAPCAEGLRRNRLRHRGGQSESLNECRRSCFNLPNISPARVTEEFAKRISASRDGHMYSPRLMKRLGLSTESGAVRASLVHYNTIEEVRRFGESASRDESLMLTDKQILRDSFSLQNLPAQNLSQQLLPGATVGCGTGRP